MGLDGKVLIRKFLVKKINIPKKVGKKIHYIIILSPKFLKKYIINKTAPTITNRIVHRIFFIRNFIKYLMKSNNSFITKSTKN